MCIRSDSVISFFVLLHKKNMIRFILFLCVAGISFVRGQYQNILINNQQDPNEPSIYMDPLNTDRLVAGSNLNLFYYSDDGGYNWSTMVLESSEYGVWGDPCLIVDTAGDIYFFHLSNPTVGSWIDRIVCQKSTDNGLSWNTGTYMGLNGTKAQDKEWAVVDRNNNNIYVTWTQFDEYGTSDPLDSTLILFSSSTDGGQSWSAAQRISKFGGDCIDSDNTVEGAVPAVGPNGEIYVAWSGPAGIRFNRSTDQGVTWLEEEIFVSDQPGGWDYDIPGIMRCNGLPVTVCDTSGGTHNGIIYVNWTDQRNGLDDVDVWLSKSTDGGDTWSVPVRVNDDAPGKHQFFAWMTVDQITGYLYFVFYDRRNDLLSVNSTDVYMAVSQDGGLTFENIKISESPFIPNSSIFFGDYTNIAVHGGVVRPIWVRMHNSVRSIMTAIITYPDVSEHEFYLDIPVSIEQNYPNPFSDQTWLAFKVERPAYVTVTVVDVFGREIARMYNNELLQPGRYVQQFDVNQRNLSPGVYFFRVITGNKCMSKKMVVQ
jgi:hypothetical protein